MSFPWRSTVRACVYCILVLVVAVGIFRFLVRPSNDREWIVQDKILPEVSIDGDIITIKNFRDFRYEEDGTPVPGYVTKTFNMNEINRVWLMVEPFSKWQGAAHSMLSFEFKDSQYLTISVEARFEEGEKFSALWGMFRRFELWYVIGSERDLFWSRIHVLKLPVSLYPTNVSKEGAKTMLTDMLTSAERIRTEPEFYNIAWNNCTSRIIDHVKKIAPQVIPLSWKVYFAGYIDELAYEGGLIDTTLTGATLSELRAHYSINEKAESNGNKADFSRAIRKGD